MKKFKNIAAQGDVILVRISEMPENLVPAKAENGRFIVAHSETGHHHTVLEKNAQLLIDKTNEFIAILKVDKETALEHHRSFDTHKPLIISPGIYQVRRQREYVPSGFRKAQD